MTPLRNFVLAVMYGVYDHIMAPLGRGIYAVAAAMYAVAAGLAKAIYGVAARVGRAMYGVAAGRRGDGRRRCRKVGRTASPHGGGCARTGSPPSATPLTVVDAATRSALAGARLIIDGLWFF